MTETREILIRLQLEYPPGLAPSMPATPEMFPLYKAKEAAELLKIGESVMWELITSGEIESIKINSSRRVSRDALERYISRNSSRGGDDAAA